MSVVTGVGLILNVSGIDCDTSCLLFGRFVYFIVSHLLSMTLSCAVHRDSCGQSGLAVVDVTDGTDIYMRFGSFEFSLSHFVIPPEIFRLL